MITIRAHFDGQVFVLDEPVDLPINTPLIIDVRAVDDVADNFPRATVGTDPETGLPVIQVPPGTKTITLEDVKRAEEEEDLAYSKHFRRKPDKNP